MRRTSKSESTGEAEVGDEDINNPSPEALAHLQSMTAFKPVAHIRGAPVPPRRYHRRSATSLGSSPKSPKRNPSSSRNSDSDSDSIQSGGIWCSDSDESDDDSYGSQRTSGCFPFVGGKRKPKPDGI